MRTSDGLRPHGPVHSYIDSPALSRQDRAFHGGVHTRPPRAREGILFITAAPTTSTSTLFHGRAPEALGLPAGSQDRLIMAEALP